VPNQVPYAEESEVGPNEEAEEAAMLNSDPSAEPPMPLRAAFSCGDAAPRPSAADLFLI
jgi:hypothetical protein